MLWARTAANVSCGPEQLQMLQLQKQDRRQSIAEGIFTPSYKLTFALGKNSCKCFTWAVMPEIVLAKKRPRTKYGCHISSRHIVAAVFCPPDTIWQSYFVLLCHILSYPKYKLWRQKLILVLILCIITLINITMLRATLCSLDTKLRGRQNMAASAIIIFSMHKTLQPATIARHIIMPQFYIK